MCGFIGKGNEMKKFLLALTFLLCCANTSRAENKSPDVLLGDPAYSDLDLISDPLILRCDFGGPFKPGAWTRYEFAVSVARLLRPDDQIEVDERMLNVNNPAVPSLSVAEVRAAFKRMIEKFGPDLKALGVNTRLIRINGELLIDPRTLPLFADVPKAHWAFDAVEKLRLSGIVVGFPDGY